MKSNLLTSVLLVVAIIVMVNVLSRQFFFRLDLTADGQYTLSKATKDILRELEEPVTVTAYFSEDLPQNISRARTDFRDLLVEYASLSKGMLNYEFVDPADNPELEQEAAQNYIQPVLLNVREKDQAKQQKAYLGAVIKLGDQSEIIPLIQPGTAMEYELSTSIKKLAVRDKPVVGLLQGHGEADPSSLSQVVQDLSILYQVEPIDQTADPTVAARFKAVAVVAPTDSFPPAHLQALDDYLAQGGNLFLALNAVQGNLQNGQGTAVSTGLESWLRRYGLEVEPSFLIDERCGSVTVQQRQGFFTLQTPVSFPYLPICADFPDHPITRGLEQVMLPFASPLRFLGDSTVRFTAILESSASSGIVPAPTTFDVMDKQWSDADFPLSSIPVGGILEGVAGGRGRIVVIGDGDFPVGGQQSRVNKDNASLLVNSIDWLSDDTGLIELRTKGVSSRPIDQAYLGDEAQGKRTFLKYLNFGLPILLVILIGFVRFQRQQRIRLRRMQERYA